MSFNLYKRKGSAYWQFDYSPPGRERIQRSTRTTDKSLAEQLAAKWCKEVWEQDQLDKKPKHLWQEAVLRYSKEKSHKKGFIRDLSRLRWLKEHLTNIPLSEITEDVIYEIMDEKEGAKPATINRYLNLIKAILNKAYKEWKWIDSIPYIRKRDGETKRERYLTKEEFKKLVIAAPPHFKPIIKFAVLTGLRKSNILNLQWKQIDLSKSHLWINASDIKTSNALAMSLPPEAVNILLEQKGKHPQFVFTYEGAPLTCIHHHTWKKMLVRAGITDLRFHDLRHTFATWLRLNSVPLDVIQLLGGWKSESMVKRYAHFDAAFLEHYTKKIKL